MSCERCKQYADIMLKLISGLKHWRKYRRSCGASIEEMRELSLEIVLSEEMLDRYSKGAL